LLAHGRWFSSGTPASSTTKTGRHDIAEILLKVELKHQKSKSIIFSFINLFTASDYPFYIFKLSTYFSFISMIYCLFYFEIKCQIL